MKYIYILFLVFIGCSTFNPMKTSITCKYDNFADETVFKLEYFHDIFYSDGGPTFISFRIANQGDSLNKPEKINMMIVQFNKLIKYAMCNNSYFVVNDIKLDIGKPKYLSEYIHDNKVKESFIYKLTFPDFEKLINAKDLKFKICNTEFVVSDTKYLTYYHQELLSRINKSQ